MKQSVALMAFAVSVITGSAGAEEIFVADFGDLPQAQVVFLGEVHDNPHHHDNQAAAVVAIAPTAVVFEMLTREKAAAVTPSLLKDPAQLATELDWANTGWPDFEIYYPVFAASAGAEIYGAQVPRAAARAAVMGEDLAEAFGEGAERFGLLAKLPEAQQEEREAKQMAAHCDALPAEMLPGMVLAQRLRDASLARAAMSALAETGGPVVVITGNGHARTDWGAPALLPQEVSVLSIAQIEAQSEGQEPFDKWLVTAAAEREDPCAAFK
ncbi:ChaN family lipoprotein [Shimia sp. Alg240-R146]|uniref:ChaN family lipoprotein n=1 Tax=Shimia sp. Alg240-R146 TaxID=2993449 RepID=UPI0022E47519|nr:ChaN family lipoprotein [Shimia sp. Alg240-R146]